MYLCWILKFIFDINLRSPIKLKKKGLNLIEKIIIYSLRNKKKQLKL